MLDQQGFHFSDEDVFRHVYKRHHLGRLILFDVYLKQGSIHDLGWRTSE